MQQKSDAPSVKRAKKVTKEKKTWPLSWPLPSAKKNLVDGYGGIRTMARCWQYKGG